MSAVNVNGRCAGNTMLLSFNHVVTEMIDQGLGLHVFLELCEVQSHFSRDTLKRILLYFFLSKELIVVLPEFALIPSCQRSKCRRLGQIMNL